MKILVTGVAGFIGSHACERLLAGGHGVIGVDNFDGSYSRKRKRRNLKTSQQNSSFKLVEGDVGEQPGPEHRLEGAIDRRRFEPVVRAKLHIRADGLRFDALIAHDFDIGDGGTVEYEFLCAARAGYDQPGNQYQDS